MYRNPVITPSGFLFDREAVLEYILAQKKDIAKRTKEWEKQNEINEEVLRKVSLLTMHFEPNFFYFYVFHAHFNAVVLGSKIRPRKDG